MKLAMTEISIQPWSSICVRKAVSTGREARSRRTDLGAKEHVSAEVVDRHVPLELTEEPVARRIQRVRVEERRGDGLGGEGRDADLCRVEGGRSEVGSVRGVRNDRVGAIRGAIVREGTRGDDVRADGVRSAIVDASTTDGSSATSARSSGTERVRGKVAGGLSGRGGGGVDEVGPFAGGVGRSGTGLTKFAGGAGAGRVGRTIAEGTEDSPRGVVGSVAEKGRRVDERRGESRGGGFLREVGGKRPAGVGGRAGRRRRASGSVRLLPVRDRRSRRSACSS